MSSPKYNRDLNRRNSISPSQRNLQDPMSIQTKIYLN